MQDVFRVNFVIMDKVTSTVDNNKGNDYKLQLLNALSEKQIIERQAMRLAEMEENRLQVKYAIIKLGPLQ